jgi:pimeloyl-ACP methyl ester carboxylesterase
VARLLRREGREVYTPTLTGFGERAHLKRPDLTMETHILDVVNVFEFEDLRDVILVGHSLGGVVIPMVAERIPERIRRVVWLAAVVLEDGKSLLESVAPSPWIQRAVVRNPDASITTDHDAIIRIANLHDGTPEDQAWTIARHVDYPQVALRAPGRLSAFLKLGLPTGYILALQDRTLVPEVCREFAGRLPDPRYAEVDGGHDCMISAPEATARALLEMI